DTVDEQVGEVEARADVTRWVASRRQKRLGPGGGAVRGPDRGAVLGGGGVEDRSASELTDEVEVRAGVARQIEGRGRFDGAIGAELADAGETELVDPGDQRAVREGGKGERLECVLSADDRLE